MSVDDKEGLISGLGLDLKTRNCSAQLKRPFAISAMPEAFYAVFFVSWSSPRSASSRFAALNVFRRVLERLGRQSISFQVGW
jgi:hypothetical protein